MSSSETARALPQLSRDARGRRGSSRAASSPATTPFNGPTSWVAAQQTDRDIASAVIFRVGSEWLALPAAAIQEITNLRPILSRASPHQRRGARCGQRARRAAPRVSLARVFGLDGDAVLAPPAAPALAIEKTSGGPGPSALSSARKRLLRIRRKDLRAACPRRGYVEGVHRYAPAALSFRAGHGRKGWHRASPARCLAWREQTVIPAFSTRSCCPAAVKRGMA